MEKKYKQFAVNFAKRAGKVIVSNFKLGMKKELRLDFSPVTVTDKKIKSMLIKEIKKLFPTHNVKGEEEVYLKNTSDYLWVCDPVDGTAPFSHGVPICTFSLALVHKGKPILGVVYDPFSKRLFFASTGQGSYLNGKRIFVNNKNSIKRSLAEFGYWSGGKYSLAEFEEELILNYDIFHFKFCSFIYPCCLVACGELDFTVFPGYTAHDVASVKIIVEEAGGKVTDIYGQEQSYDKEINGAIVSNSKLHPELVKLLKKHIKLL